MATYKIHPSIGVARVGNHPTEFFLAPNTIGGLPIECYQETGDELNVPFTQFKDEATGMIKRQGQKFRIYDGDTEVDLEALKGNGQILSYKWTVHLANQKSSWYEYAELKGNLLLGDANSYQHWLTMPENERISIRNNKADLNINSEYRRKFLLDPGPVSIEGVQQEFITINEDSGAEGYPKNFPHKGDQVVPPDNNYPGVFNQEGFGTDIDRLGDIKTDSKGNLIVLGGYGHSWGHIPLSGYGGGDTWYDDISDGSVTCEITLAGGGDPITLKAWVIVGPPDFAPEIVNISSWDDTCFDTAVRRGEVTDKLCRYNSKSGEWQFNDNFYPDYERDIKPIINRIAGYHWVANVQAMLGFSAELPGFSSLSPGDEDKALRQKYFSYFRRPEPPTSGAVNTNRQYEMFSDGQVDGEPEKYAGIPLMPLNSGSNSVSNTSIEKFLALTPTQHFFLEQWSKGYLSDKGGVNDEKWVDIYENVSEHDRASIGNVVGLPQCPGIEVTWTTQNPAIYDYDNGLYQIKYEPVDKTVGIIVGVDECEVGTCQPGDLTKRMAIPWQADYYNCSIQLVNYTAQDVNKYYVPDGNGGQVLVPMPPTYYAYWWPPQAPWDVISGQLTTAEQERSLNSEMAGLQVSYARGMNSYAQMVNGGWAALGFIRNQNTDPAYGKTFPYFVETERNYDYFVYEEVRYADASRPDKGNEDGSFVITSFLLSEPRDNPMRQRLQRLLQALDDAERANQSTFLMAGAAKAMPISHHRNGLQKALETIDNFKQIPVKREPNEVPRSGRRIRF